MNLFNRLSLKNRLLIILFLSIFISSLTAIGSFLYFNNKDLHQGVIEKSRAIHLRLEAAAHYVATQNGLQPIVERMKSKYKSSDDMSKEDKEIVLKQVPIVAAMKIGAMDSDKDDYEFRVFSDEARNKDNKATPEELIVFKKFQDNPALKEHVIDTSESITVYRPVRLTKERGCFTCHGDPSESPWNNGKDILGYKMEDWKDGKLHGVFAIKTDLIALAKKESANNPISPADILVGVILLGAILSLIIAVIMIKKPIKVLSEISKQLNTAGGQVSSVAVQISSSANELSHATSEQAASLQETSTSIEEINSMIGQNKANAIRTVDISEQSLVSVNQGKDVVEHMIKSIGDISASNDGIAEQINETNKEIENIVKIINDIGTKTKVINEIVFQTKLLSFNASVEAARAGEQGKGFSVVAEEVGNLARMSGDAALEISQLLDASIKSVEDTVKRSRERIGELVSQSNEKVKTGTNVAQQCGDVFNEILSNTSHVSKMVAEISSASQEQAQGVAEVNKTVADLDKVTHQNSINATQGASVAKALADNAEELNVLVQTLVKLIDGEGKK